MNTKDFDGYRESFRRLMAEKSIAQLRAMRSTFKTLALMEQYQRDLLIADLELMERYKTSMEPSSREEFNRIMEGYHSDF